MGYAYYEIDGMRRGYSVECKCHERGCPKRIDRGLSYLCHSCSWYFCGEHLTEVWVNDEPVEFTCSFATGFSICHKCAKEFETKTGLYKEYNDNEKPTH